MTTIRSCQRRTSIDCPTLERWCLLIEIRWPYAHIHVCVQSPWPAVPLSTLLHASDIYAGHKEPENVNRLWLIGRHKMQGADDRNRQQEGKKYFPSRLFASFAFMVRWHILYARRWPTQLSQRTFTLFYNTLFAVEFRPATVAQYPFELGVVGFWWPRQLQNRRHPSQSSRPPSGRFYTTGWCTNTRRQPPTRKHDATDTLMCV